MFLVGKNVFLQGKKDTRAIDQIDNGQMILHRDLLQTQILFSGDGEPSAGFYGSIVGNDHAGSTAHRSYAADGASGRTSALFGIHVITGQGADLKKRCVRIDEALNTLASREFVFLPLFFLCGDAAPELDLVQSLTQVAQQLAVLILVLIVGKVHGKTSLSKIRELN